MEKVKILHCVIDEKFIDSAIEIFDSIEGYENEYIILDDQKIKGYQYIKSQKVKTLTTKWFSQHCIDSNDYSIIILHSLMSINPNLIHAINDKITVVWLSWGYDIYEMPSPIKPLIPLKNKFRGNRKFWKLIINILKISKRIINEYIIQQGKNKKVWFKTINRIDFYSGVYPEEFLLLRKNKSFSAQRIDFNYVSKEFPIQTENLDNIIPNRGKNIMIGHQANPLLNHIADLHMLKKMNLPKDISIICPLSYGITKDINKIQKVGKKLFGSQFIPLLEFLPLDDYVKIYNSVNVAIYDIQRQCAVGNIYLAIWNGVKVFLPHDSVNYQYLKGIGLKVYSIEDEFNEYNIRNSASFEEIRSNRKILISHISYNVIKDKLGDSLKLVKDHLNDNKLQ